MAGLVFIGIFVFSSIFALASFIFGHFADHDVDGDHDLSDGDHGGGMPSIFSSRIISLFLVGFGGMGIIAQYVWKLSASLSSLCALGTGVVLGGLAYAILVMFYREQASSGVSASDYVDMEARVTNAIPPNGTGEVSVVVKGQLRSVFAQTADGTGIAEGQSVKIVSMTGGTATVAASRAVPAQS